MLSSRSNVEDHRLLQSIYGAKNKIRGIIDADTFLLQDNTSNQYTERFLSWMAALNILAEDFNKWGAHILDLVNDYETNINSELSENLDYPLLALSHNVETQIHNDLHRTVRFFNDLALTANLPNSKTDGALFCASRILTIMHLTQPNFQYIQGCERYVYISYLIALLFTTENDLPDIIAEASAYYLSSKLIELSGITNYLKDSQFLENHFHELDQKLLTINSNLMNNLTLGDQTSIHFALRWEILLFAEEHNYQGIVAIWDRILAHRQVVRQYVQSLCLAHFAQLPNLKLGRVQRYKNWDLKQIIADAEKYNNPESNFHWGKAMMVFLTVGAVSLVRFMNF